MGPQDIWTTELVSLTLYDPEASRACSFPIFIYSKATIHISVICSEFIYLKKKNIVRACSHVLQFFIQLVIQQLLGEISELSFVLRMTQEMAQLTFVLFQT